MKKKTTSEPMKRLGDVNCPECHGYGMVLKPRPDNPKYQAYAKCVCREQKIKEVALPYKD